MSTLRPLETRRPDAPALSLPTFTPAPRATPEVHAGTARAVDEPSAARAAVTTQPGSGAGLRSALLGGAYRPTAGLRSGTIGVPAAKPVQAPSGPSKAEKQKALDDYMARTSGPYTIKDAQGKVVHAEVKVPAHFRMVGGWNQPHPQASQKKVEDTLSAKGLLDPATKAAARRVTSGRGSPEDVVLVTQKLIDAGALPPETDFGGYFKKTPEERVRLMQWEYGLGLDCAGYTAGAGTAASGKKADQLGTLGVNTGVLGGLYYPPNKYANVTAKGDNPLAKAETGDFVVLSTHDGKDVGHHVVVYDHHVHSAADAAAKLQGAHVPAGFLSGKGDVHLYQVDSSWGAGGDPANGKAGVNRQTWVYDEGSKKWGTLDDSQKPPRLFETPHGPYDHVVSGVHRPR